MLSSVSYAKRDFLGPRSSRTKKKTDFFEQNRLSYGDNFGFPNSYDPYEEFYLSPRFGEQLQFSNVNESLNSIHESISHRLEAIRGENVDAETRSRNKCHPPRQGSLRHYEDSMEEGFKTQRSSPLSATSTRAETLSAILEDNCSEKLVLDELNTDSDDGGIYPRKSLGGISSVYDRKNKFKKEQLHDVAERNGKNYIVHGEIAGRAINSKKFREKIFSPSKNCETTYRYNEGNLAKSREILLKKFPFMTANLRNGAFLEKSSGQFKGNVMPIRKTQTARLVSQNLESLFPNDSSTPDVEYCRENDRNNIGSIRKAEEPLIFSAPHTTNRCCKNHKVLNRKNPTSLRNCEKVCGIDNEVKEFSCIATMTESSAIVQTREIKLLQNSIDELTGTIETLQTELRDTQKQNKVLTVTIDQLTGEASNRENLFGEALQQIEKLKTTAKEREDNFCSELKSLESSRDECKQLILKQNTQLQSAYSAVDKLEEERKKLSLEVEALGRIENNRTNLLEEWKSKTEVAKAENQRSQKTCEVVTHQLNELLGTLKNANEKIESMESSSAKFMSQIQNVQDFLTIVVTSMSTADRSEKLRQMTFSSFESDMTNLLEKCRNKVLSEERKADEFRHSSEQWSLERESLKNHIVHLSSALKAAEANYRKFTDCMNTLESRNTEIKKIKFDNICLVKKIRRLEGRVATVTAILMKKDNEIQVLRHEKNQLLSKLSNMTNSNGIQLNQQKDFLQVNREAEKILLPVKRTKTGLETHLETSHNKLKEFSSKFNSLEKPNCGSVEDENKESHDVEIVDQSSVENNKKFSLSKDLIENHRDNLRQTYAKENAQRNKNNNFQTDISEPTGSSKFAIKQKSDVLVIPKSLFLGEIVCRNRDSPCRRNLPNSKENINLPTLKTKFLLNSKCVMKGDKKNIEKNVRDISEGRNCTSGLDKNSLNGYPGKDSPELNSSDKTLSNGADMGENRSRRSYLAPQSTPDFGSVMSSADGSLDDEKVELSKLNLQEFRCRLQLDGLL